MVGYEDDDDSSFIGYVPTTVDPGWYLLLAVGMFAVVSNMFLPCLVSIGRKYERRRIMREQGKLTDDFDDEDKGRQSPEAEFETHLARDGKARINNEVGDTASAVPSSYVRGGRKAVEGSVVSGFSGVRNMVDNIMIPKYPDDEDVQSNVYSTTSGVSKVSKTSVFDVARTRRTAGRPAAVRRQRRAQNDGNFRRQTEEGEYIADKTIRKKLHRPDDELDDREHGMKSVSRGDAASQSMAGASGVMSNSVRRGTSDIGGTRSAISSRVSERGRTRRRPANSTVSGVSGTSRRHSPERSILSVLDDHVISPNDAADADDPGMYILPKPGMEGEEMDLCWGENAWWTCKSIGQGFDRLVELSEIDHEMKRIIKLALPFSGAGFVAGVLELIILGLIANFLGSGALAAYTMVGLLVGLTSQFFGGIIESEASLCSHARGAGNYKLAGQYVQISAVLYTVCTIPAMIVWYFVISDIIMWFGFDESVASMGRDFALVYVFSELVDGLHLCYGGLLDVIDRELWAAFIDVFDGGLKVLATWLFLYLNEDATLQHLALLWVGISVVIFVFNVWITVYWGWMNRYLEGMLGSFAMISNRPAVWITIKTSIPLSIGHLLAYGEWEILTVFANFLGPAEVTAWGVIGEMWEAFEMLTEGMGDAAEVRCAYHLGAGDPGLARKSAYKSILLGMTIASIFTAAVFIIGEDLAVWMTPDPTLQHMIADLLPYVGLGNIVLTAGTVTWALVGAQGRYRLATTVAFVCSWCITIPISCITTYVLNYSLVGIASAVVVGYSATGTWLLYVLFRSDWDRLSKHIVSLNEEEDEEFERLRQERLASREANGDDDSSSSSSSSSETESRRA